MKKRRSPSAILVAASGGFLAGAITTVLVAGGVVDVVRSLNGVDERRADDGLNVDRQDSSPHPIATIEADPVDELRDRHLEVPVQGAERLELRDTFSETRGSNRHEAIDIIAPRNTAVVAVEDGTIAKLFESKAGGTTVYQFDPSSRYTYYYAHLERYADGLSEGDHVRRGQVLGFVGTSGNAPEDVPHLHFAILRLTEKKQWWQGDPINPYDVLK
jgi:murein DD-endopeptidase MepM/ murein hydrolase activator NlpD